MAEHRAPERIEPQRLGDYLEIMTKVVFQSGMSWKVVESKWPGTRAAFRDFDTEAVAGLSPDQLDALLQDTRIIRNRRKVEAVALNAQKLIELDRQHAGFKNYLRSQPSFDALIASLRKEFRFLGDMGCFYFLYVVGEETPDYEAWCAARH